MAGNPQSVERSPLDFIHFGLAFTGFVLAVGGITVSSVSVSVLGLVLMLIGVAYFSVADADSD
jgi:hypothetical protein